MPTSPSPDDDAGAVPGVPVDPTAPVPCVLLAFADFLTCYHRHRVFHLDRLDRPLRAGRRVVLVSNHVLDLADALMFVAAVIRRYGGAPHFIGHENIIFRTPGLRELATHWGVIPSRQMAGAADALARDRLLMLFPGSGTEAATRRYRDEPYRLKWAHRTGFVRLALEHDADIHCVATVGNEEMYFQTRIPWPDAALALWNAGDAQRYRGTPVSLGLLGPHLLPALFPLPVQITHHVSPAIDLGDRARALRDPAALDALHAQVWAACQAFLDGAVARRDRHAPVIDRVVRGVEGLLMAAGL